MGNRRRPEWGDQVMPDAYAVGELAAKHLVGLSHKNLAFLNLDAVHWPFRLGGHGFQSTAEDLGAKVQLVQYSSKEHASGYWQKHSTQAVAELVSRYLQLSPRPTGIFVADDMQVAMLQPALQAAGVEIGPGKCSIISCNNERPYLVGLNPAPAEIDLRAAAVGRRGVEQLIWRLAHRDVHERIVSTIEPALVPARQI
jgi:DNA-binding LacI/PurR family transcriptional regulator